ETAEASFYEPIGPNAPYTAGVVKHHTASHPWISLSDGFGIQDLSPKSTGHTLRRTMYYFNLFSNVFHAIADIQGFCIPVDVGADPVSDYLRLANNASPSRM